MATYINAVSPDAACSSAGKRAFLVRALVPSLPDLLFVALLLWLFGGGAFGWAGLLSDGDTGWHIRTGEYILEHLRVPTVDLFSFSKAGEPWFAWEWGSDVLFALLFRAGGLKLLVLFSGAVICLTVTILFLRMLTQRVNLFVALLLCGLAAGASSIHFLARPHIFTLALLPCTLWLIERDRACETKLLWLLVPLTVLWTNLHGGFLALIACLFILTAGTGVEVLIGSQSSRGWKEVRRYAALTGACTAATFLNPYGYQLHVHVAKYLTSDWIRQSIQEFQSPNFRGESAMQYEVLLLLGVIVAATLLIKRRVVEALWILCWAHLSLSGARHVPVYAVVTLPLIAPALNGWWDTLTSNSSRKSIAGILRQVSEDMGESNRRLTALPLIFLIMLPLLDQSDRWPKDFPAEKFPVSLVTRHQKLLSGSRTLTMDQWADYLIYRSYPNQRVYIDGRSDFFGPTVGKEYVGLMNVQDGWAKAIEDRGFTVALVPRPWPLVSLLKASPEWRLEDSDNLALLFVKREIGPGVAGTQDLEVKSSNPH